MWRPSQWCDNNWTTTEKIKPSLWESSKSQAVAGQFRGENKEKKIISEACLSYSVCFPSLERNWLLLLKDISWQILRSKGKHQHTYFQQKEVSLELVERAQEFRQRIKNLKYLLSIQKYEDLYLEDIISFINAHRVLTVIRISVGTWQTWGMVVKANKNFTFLLPISNHRLRGNHKIWSIIVEEGSRFSFTPLSIQHHPDQDGYRVNGCSCWCPYFSNV